MAALKELKARIASVQSTLKITSAMKMVASAKLHRIQASMEALAEFEHRYSEIVAALCSDPDVTTASPLTLEHPAKTRATVLAFSSDSSLCGSFNANVIRQLAQTVAKLHEEGFNEITVYPVGEKIAQSAAREAYDCRMDYRHLAGKHSYDGTVPLADILMEEYLAGRTDMVCTVYNHFFSMGHQAPVVEQILPFKDESLANAGRESANDYILEPDADELLATLLPYSIRTRIYRTLLDSITAENAARMIAMQTATDNAQELIDELSLEYNKRRQQAITEELADITQGNS